MAKNQITTIKLDKSTKERLDNLKKHEKESYDESIIRLLNILNICKKSPSLASRILRDIDRSKSREKLIEDPEKLLRKKQSFQVQSIPRQIQRHVQRLQQPRPPMRSQINPNSLTKREL